MLPLGLSAPDQRALHRALVSDHRIHITVLLLTMNDEIRADVSHRFLDGQVDVDDTGAPDRSLSMTLFDPHRNLGLDAEDPGDETITGNDQILVVYSVWVEALGEWVDIPVFRGPVTALSRDASFLSVEAQGKELFGLAARWKPRNWRKGKKKTTMIAESIAETGVRPRYIDIPDLPAKIPHNMTLGRLGKSWLAAHHMANTMDRQLFFDGRGSCRLRRIAAQPCFTFRTGDGGSVLTLPQFDYDSEQITNTVWVLGRQQKDWHPQAIRMIPRKRATSPWRLGHNGEPRHYVERVQKDGITTYHEADKVARRILEERARASIQAGFDVIPIPHLEPGDLVRVETDDVATTFRLRSFSIPLTAGAPMPVGYQKRVSKPLHLKPGVHTNQPMWSPFNPKPPPKDQWDNNGHQG